MGSLPLYGYWALVLCVVVQRLLELRRSTRHEAWLKARGAQEVASPHFTAMRLVHAGWLGGCLVEAYWRQQGPGLVMSTAALLLLGLGQGLRFAAMSALQKRWTVRILTLPGAPPVTHGIYRYMRHPNYVGVVLEIIALPALFGCWITAIVCTLANGTVLWNRIRAEEAALEAAGGYVQAFAHTGRFFP